MQKEQWQRETPWEKLHEECGVFGIYEATKKKNVGQKKNREREA